MSTDVRFCVTNSGMRIRLPADDVSMVFGADTDPRRLVSRKAAVKSFENTGYFRQITGGGPPVRSSQPPNLNFRAREAPLPSIRLVLQGLVQ